MSIGEGSIEFVAHVRERDKAIQTLWEHLKETSGLAGQFSEKIGLKEHGELLGLLHDLGKATVTFNNYIRSGTGILDPDADEYVDAVSQKGKIDHSSAGAQYLWSAFGSKTSENEYVRQILSLIIMSHHSGLVDCISPDGFDNFSRKINKDDELTRLSEAYKNSYSEILTKAQNLLNGPRFLTRFNSFLVGIKEPDDLPDTMLFKVGLAVRYLFSCLIDADRLNTADFEFPENKRTRSYNQYEDWNGLVKKLDSHMMLFANKPVEGKAKLINDLRTEISEHCLSFSQKERGLYQLTVPTGGGKTLSSLRFALNHANKHGMDRILYVIPFTSILDQNAQTAREIFEEQLDDNTYTTRIVLEHHSNLTPDEENTRQKLLSENWDAPIVFTTMVQFLDTLFGYGTRNARRMHQLANSVLIFDEIQTLPVNCVYMFNMAIRFLVRSCRATVVLCTATQPLLDRVDPESRALKIKNENRIIQDEARYFKEFKRVELIDRTTDPSRWDNDAVATLAIDEAQMSGSTLIIVNTKKSASSLYNQLSNRSSFDAFHLSTGMCPAHRMAVLDSIRKRLNDLDEKKPVNPIICVSTALIEAGVDVDFGCVIRYEAGFDSILQAAGRCNRNGRRENNGRVHIVNPVEEGLSHLKDIRVGKEKTARILREYSQNLGNYDDGLLDLKLVERYYKYYFSERSGEMAYRISSKSSVERDDTLFSLLSNNKVSLSNYVRANQGITLPYRLIQSFKSAAKEFQAIDSYTIGVLVLYDEGKNIQEQLCSQIGIKEQYGLLKRAQRYSVNLFSNQFARLRNEDIIRETQPGSGIYYLDERYYSKEFGFSEDQISEMESLVK